MEAPEISWRPLGQLFVEKGLLDEERLEHALAEQAAKGGQLGEKLVELRYVSSAALARLLAEQYGVELAVDTGFGTGLRAELERRHDNNARPESEPVDQAPVLALVEPSAPQPASRRRTTASSRYAGLEEQWARLAAAEARVAELELELAAALERAEQNAAEVAFLNERLRDQSVRSPRPPRTAPTRTAQEAPSEAARLTRTDIPPAPLANRAQSGVRHGLGRVTNCPQPPATPLWSWSCDREPRCQTPGSKRAAA